MLFSTLTVVLCAAGTALGVPAWTAEKGLLKRQDLPGLSPELVKKAADGDISPEGPLPHLVRKAEGLWKRRRNRGQYPTAPRGDQSPTTPTCAGSGVAAETGAAYPQNEPMPVVEQPAADPAAVADPVAAGAADTKPSSTPAVEQPAADPTAVADPVAAGAADTKPLPLPVVAYPGSDTVVVEPSVLDTASYPASPMPASPAEALPTYPVEPVPATYVTPTPAAANPADYPVATNTPGEYVDMCSKPDASLPALVVPTNEDVRDWFLYLHNVHRRNHSAPDATWDADLVSAAQTIIASHNNVCTGGHVMDAINEEYGQNIAWGSGSVTDKFAAAMSMEMWYGEADSWTAADYGAGFDQNHITQVIWKASTSIGCAVQHCGGGSDSYTSGGWWVACNYQLPGNYNHDASQVSPPLCHPPVDPSLSARGG